MATKQGYIYRERTHDKRVVNRVKSLAEKALVKATIDAGLKTLFDMKDKDSCKRLELFLYLSAINTWTFCDTDEHALTTNYMTETQLLRMIAEVGRLVKECCDNCDNIN